MNEKSCPECKKEIPDGMKFCPHCLMPTENKTLASEYIKKKKPTAVIILAVTLLIVIIATVVGVILHKNTDEPDDTASHEDYSSESSHDKLVPEKDDSADNYSHGANTDLSAESTETSSFGVDNPDSDSRKFAVDQAHFKYDITDYCEVNRTESFNIYGSTEIAFSESDGVTNISFVDSLAAEICISVSEKSIEINCIMVDSDAQKHFEELAACLCMVLFDCEITPSDLSQGMEFSKDGNNFTLHRLSGDNGMYLTNDYTLIIEL